MLAAMRARRSCLSVPGSPVPQAREGAELAPTRSCSTSRTRCRRSRRRRRGRPSSRRCADGSWASATVSVRVNGTSTPWFADDVRAVAGAGERLDSVIVPKAESRRRPRGWPSAALRGRPRAAAASGPIGLQALIESARGCATSNEIAGGVAAPRGADPRAGGHERLARFRLAATRDPLGLRPRRRARRRPCRRAAGDRRPLSPDLRRRGAARFCRRARASSASTASGRFIPPRSSRSTSSSPPTPRRSRGRGRSSTRSTGASDGAVMLDGEMIDEASRKTGRGATGSAPGRARSR